MDVLLINPTTPLLSTRNTIPLGLAYLAAVLEVEGHRIKIIDLKVEPKSGPEIRKEINATDMVGITSTTPEIYNAYKICNVAKEEGVPVVMGGPHPSALPYESLEECDLVVRGEGEGTIVNVCNAIETGESLRDIRGILYKDKEKVVDNTPRELIRDLDSIPFPAVHLFPDIKKYTIQHPLLDRKSASGVILTSRGCPYNCVFCYKSIFGNVYRYRSSENVLSEWKTLVEKYKVREIGIVDDTFTTNSKRVIEICKMILKEKLQVPWLMPSGMRVKPISKEILEWMKKSGCIRIAFGIESGSQEVLNKIRKGITLEEVEKAVDLTKKVGLETIGLFMIGNYGEDESSIKQTIKFSKKLNLDYAIFYVATPYPGTELFEIIKNHGRFLITSWDKYGIHGNNKAYFELGDVKKELVEKMFKQAYRSFYLNPRYIKKRLLDKKTVRNAYNYIKAFLAYSGMRGRFYG
ncbi:B12-binding domain-containing radical SAM protein [[Eubacterium] cellulosolvens]